MLDASVGVLTIILRIAPIVLAVVLVVAYSIGQRCWTIESPSSIDSFRASGVTRFVTRFSRQGMAPGQGTPAPMPDSLGETTKVP